jgi:hypothetical protein
VIGDGWDGDPSVRPDTNPEPARRTRVAIVTGSRAEFGLLVPVMHAVQARPELELQVIAAGSHLIQPALTLRDVKALFPIIDSVPMQIAGRVGRAEDAQALGTGISRFARVYAAHAPDWIVVLGDRIEAFAAASAASIGGYLLAHIHGGDRAEGVADEAMRHAITKLANLHFPQRPRVQTASSAWANAPIALMSSALPQSMASPTSPRWTMPSSPNVAPRPSSSSCTQSVATPKLKKPPPSNLSRPVAKLDPSSHSPPITTPAAMASLVLSKKHQESRTSNTCPARVLSPCSSDSPLRAESWWGIQVLA